MRDAEEIGYGFLAARASIALRNSMRKQELSADERAVLVKAAVFLNEIADGALITKGNMLEGVRPSRSIAALDVAFGPLDTLKHLVKSEQHEIAPVFRRLSEAVKAVREGTDSPELAPSINDAQQFFDNLSGWLANELATRKRSAGRARPRAF
jgi:hypothetical protein